MRRCRKHKIDNATAIAHLPGSLREQVESLMSAAYRPEAKEGVTELKNYANWLACDYRHQ